MVAVRNDGAKGDAVEGTAPERLAKELRRRFQDPDLLTRAALAAKSAGVADAAERLAAEIAAMAKVAIPQGVSQ